MTRTFIKYREPSLVVLELTSHLRRVITLVGEVFSQGTTAGILIACPDSELELIAHRAITLDRDMGEKVLSHDLRVIGPADPQSSSPRCCISLGLISAYPSSEDVILLAAEYEDLVGLSRQ